ncbi:MAG: AlpA family phage regulatory protein [Proteobacteria bacterium]|nr:AlpA family phage regulatory protein [Pseudomonadota bacterium]
MTSDPLGGQPSTTKIDSHCAPATSGQPFASFDALPDSGLVRLRQLVRDPNRPDEVPVIPCSAATWWRWVATGAAPAPLKLGPKTTAWRVVDIRAWLRSQHLVGANK